MVTHEKHLHDVGIVSNYLTCHTRGSIVNDDREREDFNLHDDKW